MNDLNNAISFFTQLEVKTDDKTFNTELALKEKLW